MQRIAPSPDSQTIPHYAEYLAKVYAAQPSPVSKITNRTAFDPRVIQFLDHEAEVDDNVLLTETESEDDF